MASTPIAAQQARLEVSPVRPAPGAIVRLTLNVPSLPGDSIAVIHGEMAGEPLHFRSATDGSWRAIGGIPVDATDSVVARAIIERSSGVSDTVGAAAILPKRPPSRGRPRTLSVNPRFTRPLDRATQARIERENARAREVGRNAHATTPLWISAFLHPRASAVTSRFGSGRMFNGSVASRHLGVDFAGVIGAPVRAANRGVVALVDDFFLAGKVVYIDHGGGIVTGYFHLSETMVTAGDTVARGQQIGKVGATGRVTGPHLHWSARYGALAVNPLDLVALGTAWLGSR